MAWGEGRNGGTMKLAAMTLTCTISVLAMNAAWTDVKVGVIAPFSGPFAQYGTPYQQAIEVYQAQHGKTVGAHEIEFT